MAGAQVWSHHLLPPKVHVSKKLGPEVGRGPPPRHSDTGRRRLSQGSVLAPELGACPTLFFQTQGTSYSTAGFQIILIWGNKTNSMTANSTPRWHNFLAHK